jgi:gas vesicle protein
MGELSALIGQLGVGGAIVVLLLLDKMGLLGKDKRHSENQQILRSMEKQIDDLYKWHDVRDSDGVPKWFIRDSLEETMKVMNNNMDKLANNIGEQTVVLKELVRQVRKTDDDVARLMKNGEQ